MKFNDYFKSIPYLETDRLIIRAFQRDDMRTYIEFIGDPIVQKYLGGGVNVFEEEPHITNWLKNINGRLLKSKTVFTWCIIDKAENTVIGRIDLGGFVKQSMAEISYYLSPMYWGKGLATEAVREVLRFGFEDLKLHRIQAMVLKDNIASQKVLLKSGFEQEGVLRLYYFGKEFHDTILFSSINEMNLNRNNK